MRTAGQWLEWAAERLQQAGVFFGHGTDNAVDEAAWLVLHALGESPAEPFDGWDDVVAEAQASRIEQLVEQRIARRLPAAYLTGTAWFAGLEFEVSPDVLVPRSPIAELIAQRFHPWLVASEVTSILDIGTGSGCIAIACALTFPAAQVVATDISETALSVAAANARRHAVEQRLELVRSDVFDSLHPAKYDLIVSNPPYVPAASIEALPEEYRAEPELGLLTGMEGLEIPLRILAGAAARLNPGGALVCEVGESQQRLQQALPTVPFVWLEFESGGEGVFVLDHAELQAAAEQAQSLLRDTGRVT